MINHGRTLLLNTSSAGSPGESFPGEEYISPTFQPLLLPSHLQTTRALLLGRNPDRAWLNYRLRELFTLIHSTELEEYLLSLDPRVTYLPFSTSLYNSYTDNVKVYQTQGVINKELIVLGDKKNLHSEQQLLQKWIVTVLSSSVVRIQNIAPSQQTLELTYAADQGLSVPLGLPGSNLSFTFQTDSVGTSWLVEVFHYPSKKLPGLIADLENSSATSTVLEGVETTFSNLWYQQQMPLPYRLGSLTLALIYQIDTIYRREA